MKTIIPINGLDVEFSDTPPTRAGAYWWRHPDAHAKPVLKEVFNPCSDVLIDRETDWQPKDVGGLWSAPLVPAVEVERAWDEATASALISQPHPSHWYASRACRVVEGAQ